jgi:PAS domain S-box-containing protein
MSAERMRFIDQLMLDLLPDAGFLFLNRKKILLNQQLVKLFRYNSKRDFFEHLKNGYQIFEDVEKSRVKDDISRLMNYEKIRTRKYKFVRKDNTHFYGKVTFKALFSPHSNQPIGYFGTVHNVNNDKIVLKGAKKKYYSIYNDSGDTVIIIDYKGNILTANKKLFQFNFFADKSIKNYNFFNLIDKAYHEQLRDRIEQIRNGNHTTPMEYKLINDFGKSVYVELNSQPIKYHNRKAIITQIRNISDRKEMEQKLLETIIQTEEKERQRFAEDLHDELGPFLSGIKLYIDQLELSYAKNAHSKKLVEYLRKMVDEAIRNTRTISNNLMSNTLMDFGLGKALTSFVEKLNNTQQIKINLDIKNLNSRPDKMLEILIYRIIIELINNSIKHANPDKIDITLIKDNSYIKAIYKDDGIGFNLDEELKLHRGIGLSSIVNRLKSKQASYSFSSKIQEGMQFEFQFPLN